MDLRIEAGGKEKGKIHYDEVPVFQYIFREMGFDIDLDLLNQKITLSSGLTGKKIIITQDSGSNPNTFRKHHLEKKVLRHIQKFLGALSADVHLIGQNEAVENADFHIRLSLLEVPNISKPLLDLTLHPKLNHRLKLAEVIQSECKKAETTLKFIENTINADPNIVKFQLMYPVISNGEFWNSYGERLSIMIILGVLARFQGNSPLSIFSLVPLENLLTIFNFGSQEKPLVKTSQKINSDATVKSITMNEKKLVHIKEADVYFDYHLLLDKNESKKVQLLGHLHIKNTGTEILHNPIICLRATPSEHLKITGQIMPPNFAQTKGVMNNEGTKGWRYLKEDWFEEFEEKGEIWICPIQSLAIQPRQKESLTNLQIRILNPAAENIRIEAYVFFRDQELEVRSNNQISLSLLQNKKDGE